MRWGFHFVGVSRRLPPFDFEVPFAAFVHLPLERTWTPLRCLASEWWGLHLRFSLRTHIIDVEPFTRLEKRLRDGIDNVLRYLTFSSGDPVQTFSCAARFPPPLADHWESGSQRENTNTLFTSTSRSDWCTIWARVPMFTLVHNATRWDSIHTHTHFKSHN